jgi:putative ABC transport system permease protein
MVIMLIILLIAVVGIFNTVFMSVYERIREIGVLRANGMKGGDITTMFVLEGVITGLLGSLLGLALGLGINLLLVVKGIPMEKIAGNMSTAAYGIAGNIYGQWNWPGISAVFILGVLVAAIAGIIPARKAGRIRVVEALRFI